MYLPPWRCCLLRRGMSALYSFRSFRSEIILSSRYSRASLCPGASLWTVLGLLFFDPKDYAEMGLLSYSMSLDSLKYIPITSLITSSDSSNADRDSSLVSNVNWQVLLLCCPVYIYIMPY